MALQAQAKVVSGRIGITDAEILVKKFSPTFDAEDLTKMPNYQSVTSVMINNVPSAPFSMSFVPPMGQSNPQLSDALKRLSAAKYGKPRTQVEKEIFARLGAADAEKKAKAEALKKSQQERMTGMNRASGSAGGSSFLDEWLSKRKQMGASKPPTPTVPSQPPVSAAPLSPPVASPPAQTAPQAAPRPPEPVNTPATVDPAFGPPLPDAPSQQLPEKLSLRGDEANHESEVSIKWR